MNGDLRLEDILRADDPDSWHVDLATILAAGGSGTVVVNLKGSTLTIPHLRSYQPLVNDVVLVLASGARRYVIGAIVNPSVGLAAGSTAPTPSQPAPSTPDVPVSSTAARTFTAFATGDYQSSSGWHTDTVSPKQGDFDGSGVHTGAWFYGTQIDDAFSTGAIPSGGQIYLQRGAGGTDTSDTPTLQLHSNTSQPAGAVTPVGSTFTVGALAQGQGAWFPLPMTAVTALSDGTASGVLVKVATSTPFIQFADLSASGQSGAIQITYTR